MDIATLLPLPRLPAPTLTPATPEAPLPADFAALLTQASLTVPDAPTLSITPPPHPVPSLPVPEAADRDTALPVAEPVDDDTLLAPEMLALMASLPAIAPPPQHNPEAAEQLASATPQHAGMDAVPAPLTTVPAAPHTATALSVAPTLTDTVQRQTEQAEAPVISAPRDNATPLSGATQTLPGSAPAAPNTAPGATFSASLSAPVNSPQWPQDFSQQLVQFSRGLRSGEQRVEMHLNPAHLGPLSVSLSLDEQSAQAQFFSVHAPVRAAVEQAIPQLREALAEQGISLGEAMVGEHRQPPGEQPGSHRGQARANPMQRANALNAEPAATTTPLHTHGVDLYA